jgi:hypothetical protein
VTDAPYVRPVPLRLGPGHVILCGGVRRRLLKVLTMGTVLSVMLGIGLAAGAQADDWLPHPAAARWQYQWSDSRYHPGATVENVVVQQQQGVNYTFAWAQAGYQPPAAGSALVCPADADLGTMSFQDTPQGPVNTSWNSCPPSSSYPSGQLCPAGTGACPDSLAGFLYNVIWGLRDPVVQEPLVRGLNWSGTGGASGDAAGTSAYVGQQVVKVPAFPTGVNAAVIRTNVALAGTEDDAYGSGVRTTWWVYGIGPVRVVFDHVDGAVTSGSLLSTSLTPKPDPADENYFPMQRGLTGTYRWTNNRHMRKPEVDRVTVGAVAGSTARFDVKSLSGPIRAAGAYDFTSDLDGIRNTAGSSSAATLLTLPKLTHGRHFFTVIDLMVFGFNPLLPAYPGAGDAWRSGNARDQQVYGVRGSTRIVGVRRVKVPAGTFTALEVRSVLTQHGSRYGSGVRTMWFAPGRGLVKLVFAHRDRSTSTVVLVR